MEYWEGAPGLAMPVLGQKPPARGRQGGPPASGACQGLGGPSERLEAPANGQETARAGQPNWGLLADSGRARLYQCQWVSAMVERDIVAEALLRRKKKAKFCSRWKKGTLARTYQERIRQRKTRSGKESEEQRLLPKLSLRRSFVKFVETPLDKLDLSEPLEPKTRLQARLAIIEKWERTFPQQAAYVGKKLKKQ